MDFDAGNHRGQRSRAKVLKSFCRGAHEDDHPGNLFDIESRIEDAPYRDETLRHVPGVVQKQVASRVGRSDQIADAHSDDASRAAEFPFVVGTR
jgi:hypothetical protein